jgi:hypothetical protein
MSVAAFRPAKGANEVRGLVKEIIREQRLRASEEFARLAGIAADKAGAEG